MTRDDNRPVEIEAEVNERIVEYLRGMVASGLWGRSVGEVAGNLLMAGIRREIADGLVELNVPGEG